MAEKLRYMEVPRPSGDGMCSDRACPCGFPGEAIPRGTGFMYVSDEVVAFRRDCLSLKDAEAKAEKLLKEKQADSVLRNAIIVGTSFKDAEPILVCERGARKRNLDLEVAAVDARHWWETGLVPLRATPRAPRAPEQEPWTSPEEDATLRMLAEFNRLRYDSDNTLLRLGTIVAVALGPVLIWLAIRWLVGWADIDRDRLWIAWAAVLLGGGVIDLFVAAGLESHYQSFVKKRLRDYVATSSGSFDEQAAARAAALKAPHRIVLSDGEPGILLQILATLGIEGPERVDAMKRAQKFPPR